MLYPVWELRAAREKQGICKQHGQWGGGFGLVLQVL